MLIDSLNVEKFQCHSVKSRIGSKILHNDFFISF
jgi:hypothetical protein